MKNFLTIIFALLVCFSIQLPAQVPTAVLISIIKAEDERRFDKTMEDLMRTGGEKLRIRAALAAGRIGDERAAPALINLLGPGSSGELREMAAFALGEIESVKAADAILKILKTPNVAPGVRARLVEAAGKIAAVNAKDPKAIELGKAILDVLDAEAKQPKRDRLTVLLGLTAILRAKPEGGDFIAAKFLTDKDARVRADAANTLSRIRAKIAGEELRAMLLADSDAIVRANAARALGAAEDKDAFDSLLEAAAKDKDLRVRVSAIRALSNLKDKRAADKLLERGEKLLAEYKTSKFAAPVEKNELLEIASALGRVLPNSNDERAVEFMREFREAEKSNLPEIEVAFARIAPKHYLNTESLISINYDASKQKLNADWKTVGSVAQGLGETASLETSDENSKLRERAVIALLSVIENPLGLPNYENVLARAMPDALRAFAAFKTNNLPEVLRAQLNAKDVIVRATAVELLGELPPEQIRFGDFEDSFRLALEDKKLNDALLATIEAIGKQKTDRATDFLKDRLYYLAKLNPKYGTSKYLARRRIIALLKEKGAGDFSDKIGKTDSVFTQSDYIRAVLRRNARAILTTDKGIFTIEFTPEDAPLTVDNFIKLARANYFNGAAIHRVVPNFVVQDGDPRGDGNGGPGWEVRDEINMLEYERGAVGMALSGKDTGGSQWFVTHSPQPHLDGGYTIFGRVNESDMKVVDNLVRGDKITSVKIVEGNPSPKKRK
jgi:cyclophilin family peptidyl-prolyl cis-trans isomerase/HEAT repeat protein